ncbi:MAG: flavin reductase family protein [Acidobacteriota bacterium]|jgi:flavin reductase (DIM6/NTAB) family NADH-FMN oxidoreductase RutF|nr:flavin reductase family protein [Acidobacteriota bacterium]
MGKIKLEQKAAGPLPILGFYPTIMIGVDVDEKPDFTTVAWTGVASSIPPHITIALQHHRHSLKGVRRHMAFSVNIPSGDQVKETDYCGLASGARIDKVADCHFDVFYGRLKNVPFIEQCPINHGCEVVQILNLGSHELIVGKVVESFITEECLTDGRPDPAKVNAFLFAGFGYYTMGQHLGNAFRCGIDINPKARLDTLEELKKREE